MARSSTEWQHRESAFSWPTPIGWLAETIPFPLDFAPELNYKGVEELRFAPGFFNSEAQNYWTYAFAWWLDADPRLNHEMLEVVLPRYYSGLCAAVGRDKYVFDADRFRASVAPISHPLTIRGHRARSCRGVVATYDPFATGRPLTLQVEVVAWNCRIAGRSVAVILASPRDRGSLQWKALAMRRRAFACH